MEPAHFSREVYFVLEDVAAREALFSFGFSAAARARLVLTEDEGSRIVSETRERTLCGRLRVGGLTPGRAYTADCVPDPPGGQPGAARIRFSTPEDTGGVAAARFAVLADPHVSLDRENRRGRLFQESRRLLEEALADVAGSDAVLLPGDVTDAGKPEELAEAQRILSIFGGRVFAVPGDHDAGGKSSGTPSYVPSLFPAMPFLEEWRNLRILGLDTSSGVLGREQLALLADTVTTAGRLLILSHHDILPNPAIADADGVITDHAEPARLLRDAAARWVIYAGHKNVPLLLRTPRGIQVNVPQICHYPAGFLSVSVYPDRLSHRFVPIRSEILREYSLRMLWEDSSPSMGPAYRYGSITARSFDYAWGAE